MDDLSSDSAAMECAPAPLSKPGISPPDTCSPEAASIESEMKFTLDATLAGKLLKSRLVRKHARSRATTRQLTSTYFDTRQHTLRKTSAALRVRKTGNRFEQTLKLASAGLVGMQNNEEWNVPLANDQPDPDLFDKTVMARVRPAGRKINLQPVFTTEIRRTALVLGRGNTRFEIALDIGEIRGHGAKSRRVPVSEVEFELLKGSPLAMLDFILELCNEIDLVPLYLSKAQRGYGLARPSLRPGPTKARAVLLSPDMSVGEAFNKIVAEALRHLSTSHQPVQEGSPQGVHQARVSIRRIRAALRAFKKSLPYDKRKAFNGEFRWFQARLAPARDWHVFLSETVPSIQESRPRSRVSLANLARGAATERRRATAEARELFKSRRFTRLVLEFQRWVLALELEKGAMFDLELKPFAQGVLDKTRRDFLLDIRPLSRMSEEDRHSLRKRGKKARYATEFFAGLWQGRQVDNYLQLMEKIQDLLGEANDAVVARQVLATLPPRLLKPSTIWRVQQWSEQRVRHNIKVGQPLWRRVKTAEPFWV